VNPSTRMITGMGYPLLIEEDNSDDSDVDQPDNESLHQSTLFWSTQRILSADQEDKLSLGIPPVGHQMKGVPGSFLRIVSS
jgi:hypothetical protein